MKKPILATLLAFMLFSFKSNEQPQTPKILKNKYNYIPAGEVKLEDGIVRCAEFWMSSTEVSNKEYATFLNDLKAGNKMDLYKIAEVDSNKWRLDAAYNEPFVKYYFSHPAYAEYPVVNVSHEAAELYCTWLSEQLNKSEDGKKYYFNVRLPSRAEWVYAANGKLEEMPYAWGGPSLRNAKGCILCNCYQVGSESIHFNENTGKYEVVDKFTTCAGCPFLGDDTQATAPVISYSPNNYGLYCMNGNVAEMVKEQEMVVGGSWKSAGFDVRNMSTAKYSGAAPTVGFRVLVELHAK